MAEPRLLKSTTTVSSMTFLSRIAGFARDMVVAQLFGATAGVDAFFVAFKIPNFMRRLFAEGAFSQAFVPVLSEYREQQGEAEAKLFIDRIAGSLASALLAITVLGILAAPFIILLFAPGFDTGGTRYELASHMLRITFPYLLLISLTAFVGAVQNSYGRFAVPAFTPVLLNICMIAAAFYWRHYFATPVIALAWGVFAAGIVQLLFQVPFLYRRRLLPRPRLGWHDPGVMRVLKLMVPALFGVSVAQVNLMLDMVFASFLQIGSVSWLYYSDRLTQLPLGVFGVAIATVILPHLSRQFARGSKDGFANAVDWGIRSILLIGVPASLGLAILAAPLLISLFNYGAFAEHDVLMATRSLIAFALGLPAFMLVKTLAAAYYSRQDIKTPVKIGVYAMVANTVMNCIFIWPLQHAGLALSTSLAAWLNVSLLAWGLYRDQAYQPRAGWRIYLVRLLSANIVMLLWMWWLSPARDSWFGWGWRMRVGHLALLVVGAILSYFATLRLTGLRYRDLRLAQA